MWIWKIQQIKWKNAVVSRIKCIKQEKELEAKNFEIIQVRVKQRKRMKTEESLGGSVEYQEI